MITELATDRHRQTQTVGRMFHHLRFVLAVALVFGIAGACGLARLLASKLMGLSPLDPVSFIGVSLLSMLAAVVACYLPARRAAKVDPMVALRYE